ncbi:hypothetical protein SLU01_15690 [Sporosarcina luteola]|uniref:Uncharacterized protein n=1 Tax=Sporosarcina luteola TaxID=582850 RepID=A0A511Z733_9BACL|nr:hypothetical protein SLU01_15690 [Sporosarcina luteola]
MLVGDLNEVKSLSSQNDGTSKCICSIKEKAATDNSKVEKEELRDNFTFKNEFAPTTFRLKNTFGISLDEFSE